MPDDDDFYIKENIIGYTAGHTGQLDNTVTVYFLRIQHGRKQTGHITQIHDKANNIGRNQVRKSSTYEMRLVDGKLEEWIHGEKFHTSRSSLVRIPGSGRRIDAFLASFPMSEAAGIRDFLAQAIDRFPNRKARYSKHK